ncbi:MAG: four helix bundle protein [Flavobacteriales bacterium]|jgi:four helix bundle protein|nr:four helix bundle protein [Flavobacteriales bacterium]MBK6752468.1 four helix bundle protein [Flavobacteriales bacterium]MBK7084815.1 four helix bundle protein [Flavobacteriales bacterium]MBK7268769.1 four helix bundle protein [Flavobacteriales bacterium]MBK7752082.1 four helix bundle protein [Flavobacteriales bacterium]
MEQHEPPKKDLQERLEHFAIMVVKLTERMPMTPVGKYYSGQLLRSGGSAALNYGESQGGETHRDFTHKLKIVLKEMKESHVCLRIIRGAELHSDTSLVERALQEAKELVAIFTTSVKTAEQRSPRR